MNKERSESDRILQIHRIEEMDHLFDGPWVTLYLHERDRTGLKQRRCVLLTKDAVSDVLRGSFRDPECDEGWPSYIYGADTVEYLRRGGLEEKGMEPLIFAIESPNGEEKCVEISEEFRLFHKLWHDRGRGHLIGFDDEDEEEIVAKITDSKVCVNKRHLVEFMAAKQMYLALYFILDEEFDDKKKIPTGLTKECLADDRAWSRGYLGFIVPRSMLVGKIVFPPGPMPSFNERLRGKKKYQEFIIEKDGDGSDVMHSCDPAKLDQPNGPPFLTPIYFKHSVLEKYNRSLDYSVEDGCVAKKGRRGWSMQIDNNHSAHIFVFLGDLAKIPNNEQIYWKSCNISSSGGMSNAGYRRSLLGEFADPEAPNLVFKYKFQKFQDDWKCRFDWHFFQPLSQEESHVFDKIHIPSNADVEGFESQVGNLAKLVIQSLNTDCLRNETGPKPKKKIRPDGKEITGNFARLEYYLEKKNYLHAIRDVDFLIDLQKLRSLRSAHLRTSESQKADYRELLKRRGSDSNEKTLQKIFSSIIKMLDDMRQHFLK